MIITNAIISFYIWTGQPCADWVHYPTPHLTVAAPRWVPLGTVVHIDGFGDYVVQDRTNISYDGRWDIYTDGTAEHARQLGIKHRTVTIYENTNTRRR